MTRPAIAVVGPWTGLRVYDADDTSRPILHIDACAVRVLEKWALDALQEDEIRIERDGVVYAVPAGRDLARVILTALWQRG